MVGQNSLPRLITESLSCLQLFLKKMYVIILMRFHCGFVFDNDNDVYFSLATSDSRIGKYKTVGEQLTHKKNRSVYNAIG